MKYTTLKSDIVNIIHSADYNLYLKFYNQDGNTTLNPEDAKWCYINNYNIMLEFMDDDNPNLIILKDSDNATNSFKEIVQRIRELAVLNGVSVQIRAYNDLNQRKLYNFIKNNIIQTKQKEEEMNESLNNDENILLEMFCNMINTAKHTKRKSDFYLSETMKMEITHNILNEMISEIKSLSSLKNVDLTDLFKNLLSSNSLSNINNVVSETLKNKKLSSKLIENKDNINNIVSFVKNEYLNHISFNDNKPKSLFVLENAKVYLVKEFCNKENLINAYNKLISESSNIQSGTDIIRVIRNLKLCETYNVTRKELLDMWLAESSNNPIKHKKAFIIEDAYGNKHIFNENLAYGIKAIASYINVGGSRDDEICKNIIYETIKYNEISSFLKEYQDSYRMLPYNLKLKKLIKENIRKLSSNDYKLFEYVDSSYDYSEEYEKLCEEMDCEHPAIKYLALENAKENALYAKILIENNMNDLNVLQKTLKPYTKSLSELETLIESIMKGNIKVKEPLKENINNKNILNQASNLYKQLCFENDSHKSIIASVLFNIIHSKYRIDESKIKFINVLNKYL